ncbi:MAG: hypothetical protein MUO76_17750 [Anaerolineaceae bacterium]|nr:hypothetical protein [Anaerolineaceae bacterium]
MFVNDAIKEFMFQNTIEGRSKVTLRRFRASLEKFALYAENCPVEAIDNVFMKTFVAGELVTEIANGEVKPVKLIRKRYSLVRLFAQWLYAQGYLLVCPVEEPASFRRCKLVFGEAISLRIPAFRLVTLNDDPLRYEFIASLS